MEPTTPPAALELFAFSDDELLRRLAEAERSGRLTYGTVADVSPTLTVTVGPSTVAVAATRLASYVPTIGDYVAILERPGDRVILGKAGNAIRPMQSASITGAPQAVTNVATVLASMTLPILKQTTGDLLLVNATIDVTRSVVSGAADLSLAIFRNAAAVFVASATIPTAGLRLPVTFSVPMAAVVGTNTIDIRASATGTSGDYSVGAFSSLWVTRL